MNEINLEQARSEEIYMCRERPWLSMEDEKRFVIKNTAGDGEYLGNLSSPDEDGSRASFDRVMHTGQNVYLINGQFIGLIVKLFRDTGGHISYLVIRTARIFGRYKVVPIKAVSHVTPSSVHLSMSHEQFDQLKQYPTEAANVDAEDRAFFSPLSRVYAQGR